MTFEEALEIADRELGICLTYPTPNHLATEIETAQLVLRELAKRLPYIDWNATMERVK